VRARTLRWACLALLLAGCAKAPYDAETLRLGHPGLAPEQARALAGTMPYLLPAAGRITWFVCRHDASLPLLVSLVGEASAEEEAALDVALSTLERSIGPLRFVRVPPEEATIHVEFVEGLVAREQGEDQANTIADCRVAAEALGAAPRAMPATLVRARVRVGRGGPQDPLGRERRLSEAELTGVLLHELGHALGLPGHREGEGILTRNIEALGRLGREAIARRSIEAPALAGLYHMPEGAVLARASVSTARTHLVDRMGRLVEGTDVEGPFVRVGDTLARIYWRDAKAREYGVQVLLLEELLRHPEGLVILPEARTRRALPSANDPALDD
jgi:hypothetical protein